jgi:hypothetical protein
LLRPNFGKKTPTQIQIRRRSVHLLRDSFWATDSVYDHWNVRDIRQSKSRFRAAQSGHTKTFVRSLAPISLFHRTIGVRPRNKLGTYCTQSAAIRTQDSWENSAGHCNTIDNSSSENALIPNLGPSDSTLESLKVVLTNFKSSLGPTDHGPVANLQLEWASPYPSLINLANLMIKLLK